MSQYWPYILVSIIWITSELSASHLSRATAIFVVDCCQFGPSWIFGLKMELMACADSVGVTTEQRCLFPDLIWKYQWYDTCKRVSKIIDDAYFTNINNSQNLFKWVKAWYKYNKTSCKVNENDAIEITLKHEYIAQNFKIKSDMKTYEI